MKKPPLFYLVYAIQFVGVFCAYYFAARWSLSISAINTFAAPLWPPTGIALAALYFGGSRLAPAVALAAFAVNYMTGAPALAALGIALGNSLEAIVGLYLLRSFRFRPFFEHLGDSFSLIAVALSAPFTSAITGPVALVAAGALSTHELPITSITWWIGDALGVLLVAPFILKWFARPAFGARRTILQWTETLLFFIALTFVSIIVFWQPIPALNDLSWPYLVFVPLTWGALRVGPRFVTSAIVLVAAIATTGTVMGVGPFSGTVGVNDLFFLQLFLGTVAMIFLLFSATVEERKRAAQELEKHVVDLSESVEEISEADRAKNEFIAILSHELRNPLAPVLSSLELLRLNIAKMPEFKDTIDTMHDQIGRITRLLDDLLDITRISRKKFDLQITRTNLQDVLAHSFTMVQEEIRKRGHTFTSHLPETPIWVEGDSLRLEQVFVNLLNNAAKYTDAGGSIRLSAIERGKEAEIRIHDTGIGISPEMLRVIFEPFRQAHAAGRGSAGLGIGLSLAKRFIELHGGSIDVESGGLGKGSEFSVRLPIAKTPLLGEGAPVKEKSPVHAWNLPKKKERAVLIVDDNVQAAEGIAKLLNHAGHVARIAHDGISALHTLASFHPEIIFLDIGLPDGSGYELAQKIRQYLSPQPIIVALTGYGQEDDRQRAHEEGFDAHLTKPVSIADLEKVMERA